MDGARSEILAELGEQLDAVMREAHGTTELHDVQPPSDQELLELPDRLEKASRGWTAAKSLYEDGVITSEERDAIQTGMRALLGLEPFEL